MKLDYFFLIGFDDKIYNEVIEVRKLIELLDLDNMVVVIDGDMFFKVFLLI